MVKNKNYMCITENDCIPFLALQTSRGYISGRWTSPVEWCLVLGSSEPQGAAENNPFYHGTTDG